MRLKTLSLGILTAAVLASLQATPAAAAPPGLAASFASATTTQDVALAAPMPATDGTRAEPSPARAAPRFEVTVAPEAHAGPLTGRLIVAISNRESPEPRLLISPRGPAIFAVDLEGFRPGAVAVVDDRAISYPFDLPELPPGEYWAQAIINVYEQVRRADGHTLWLPMNDGRQEPFNAKAGNLYSDVQRFVVGEDRTVRLEVRHVIPQRDLPPDTEWIKRVKIQSRLLTEFWGRPIYIHATVLLPKGFDENPNVRYPAIYTFGHNVPFGFTTDSTRVRGLGRIDPVTGVETGYDFYKSWIADDFPRVVAISFQQQTPYFPDSYSTNSANNGPYEDALLKEVIPYLEERFRLIPEPYARIVEGASTGGWQALALQLRNPDFFGGAWVLQPDPIDFRRYLLVNIYEDENAFEVQEGMFTKAERPFRRTVEGQVVWTMRQLSRFEAVLGSRGRSGYQLNGWESVYGPVGEDGYPKPLWDPLTGKIDRDVAHYMRDNGYDLRAYAEREWARIGPKLAGKLHFFVPDMDDFYLNVAMYLFEDFLEGVTNPSHEPSFTYGRPKKGHSWHAYTWAETVRQMAAHIRRNAPAGASAAWWPTADR